MPRRRADDRLGDGRRAGVDARPRPSSRSAAARCAACVGPGSRAPGCAARTRCRPTAARRWPGPGSAADGRRRRVRGGRWSALMWPWERRRPVGGRRDPRRRDLRLDPRGRGDGGERGRSRRGRRVVGPPGPRPRRRPHRRGRLGDRHRRPGRCAGDAPRSATTSASPSSSAASAAPDAEPGPAAHRSSTSPLADGTYVCGTIGRQRRALTTKRAPAARWVSTSAGDGRCCVRRLDRSSTSSHDDGTCVCGAIGRQPRRLTTECASARSVVNPGRRPRGSLVSRNTAAAGLKPVTIWPEWRG